MVYRQDGWTATDDKILATEVLRNIREGKTQLSAFQKISEQLNRTPSACGFRWNSALRKIYDKEIQTAKVERKARKRQNSKALGNQVDGLVFQSSDLDTFELSSNMHRDEVHQTNLDKLYWKLCAIQKNYEEMLQVMQQFESLHVENERLRKKLFDMERDFRIFVTEFGTKNFSNK